MKADYDAKSFWSGVVVGTQLHGVGAYGVMAGWNPDSDLILRPVTQGIGRISFGEDQPFTVCGITDTVVAAFPAAETQGIVQEIGRIRFGTDDDMSLGAFTISALVEARSLSLVIKTFTLDADFPGEYDHALVRIADDAFVLRTAFDELSEAAEIDSGELQVLELDLGRFESITTQEVSF